MSERANEVTGKSPTIGRRTLIAGAGSALALPASSARAQTAGVALVIGNSKYQWESSLPNVKRDVADIAKSFQALGLRTELLQDLGRAAMLQALDRFQATAKGAPVAVFYFAGHGIVTGDKPANFMNNIVPADSDLSSAAGANSVVSVLSVAAALEGAAARLGVFDACRNNPADGWRNRHVSLMGARSGVDQILTRQFPPETLMLYSAAPGYTAPDGPAGQNSPFCSAFLRQLAAPPVDLQTLPGGVRRDLLIATQGRQMVFNQSTVTRSIALAGTGTPVPRANYNPANIVELPNAYAMARAASMPIPAGLVGYRVPGNRDGQKVGAFKYEFFRNPALFIVLTAEEGRADALTLQTIEGQRPGWRRVQATVKGDTISYMSADEQSTNDFRWSDANSGSFIITPINRGNFYNARFTRID